MGEGREAAEVDCCELGQMGPTNGGWFCCRNLGYESKKGPWIISHANHVHTCLKPAHKQRARRHCIVCTQPSSGFCVPGSCVARQRSFVLPAAFCSVRWSGTAPHGHLEELATLPKEVILNVVSDQTSAGVFGIFSDGVCSCRRRLGFLSSLWLTTSLAT